MFNGKNRMTFSQVRDMINTVIFWGKAGGYYEIKRGDRYK